MLKQLIIILLIGLCFIGTMGGSSVVICQAADGTITIESAILNNCICSDDITDSTASEKTDKYNIRSYDWCIDTPVIVTTMITAVKARPNFHLLSSILDSPLQIPNSSSFCSSQFIQPSTFKECFSPLSTIILLV
jgi:hypothetical protein